MDSPGAPRRDEGLRAVEVRRFSAATERLDVIDEIAPTDDMFHGGEAHYFESGRSALECIEMAMLLAGKSRDVSSILDFPCGFGRSLRTLAAAFPDARLTACDLQREGVDFCAQKFGATPVYSHEEADHVCLHDTYDLIWSGSFFTHLNERRFGDFLSLFESVLAPGGLVVFTVHSVGHLRALRSREMIDGEARMVEDFQTYGFGYWRYPNQDFGDALASPVWVTDRLQPLHRLRLTSYSIMAWHGSQDVVACVRKDS
jgi:SAM-dependent methyltransferase